MLGKKIKLKYIYSFFRCFLIKLKYGSKIKINPFKVYISPLSSIEISGDAHVIVRDDFDRVYISKNTKINCSGGVLVIGNGVFFNENSQLVCHESINI
jgi:hypothetical protein